METLEHRKVKMQVVKLTLIILCLAGHDLFSQDKTLSGKYSWVGPAGLLTLSVEFEDTYFKYRSVGDFGPPFISKGYYLIKNDTLILMHDRFQHPHASTFKILKKADSITNEFGKPQRISQDLIQLSLKVSDNDNHPIVGCQVGLMKGDKALSWFLTNADGELFIHTEGRIADKVVIDFIGFMTKEINLNDL